MITLDTLRDKNFATVAEVASVVFDGQVDERTIRRAIEDGTITAVKLGARTLIPVPPLLALFEGPSKPVPASLSAGVNVDAVRVAVDMIAAGVAALRSLTANGDLEPGVLPPLRSLGGDHADAA